MKRVAVGFALIAMLASDRGWAAEGKPACAGPEAGLSGTLLAWARPPKPVSSALDLKTSGKARIGIGEREHLLLADKTKVTFVHATEAKDMPKQYVYAGLMSFWVPNDGTYSVALSEGMWIDVVQNGALVTATTFGHGPACSTIGKKVEFPLKKGDAFLQLFGAPYNAVDVLIVPAL